MKVALSAFDPVPAPKGAAAHILANAEILSRDHEVAMVTLGDAPLQGRAHLVVKPEGEGWLRRAVAFHDRCRAIFAKTPFDVHHARSPFEGLAAPLASQRVAEVNALYSVELPYRYPALTDRPEFRDRLRALELTWLERAHVILTPSPLTARYLGDLGFEDVCVVPNAPSISPVASPLRSRDGVVRLVYIGTLSAWQGLPAVLLAMAALPQVPMELTVLTGSRDRKWVDKRVQKLGLGDRVRFDPPMARSELGAFLATQDIGLAPLTPSERNLVQGCMPIKILDYMAAGLPVLAPDLPVVRHLLGVEAPLYRAWSQRDLTSVLEHLATSEPGVLGAAGRARVAEQFSHAVQAAALRAAYARLATA